MRARWLNAAEFVPLMTICAVALVLRMYGLGAENLWVDEAWSLWLAEGDFAALLEMVRVDVHPPLYYLFLHSWIRVSGISEVALRLPSVLFSTAAVLMTYFVGRRFVGQRAALAAAAMLAVSPYQLQYAQEARSYALLLLLAVVSMGFFVSMLACSGLRYRLGWLLTMTLLLYCHYAAVILLVCQNLAFAVAWAGQQVRGAKLSVYTASTKLSQWLGLQVACVVLFLPGVVLMIEQVYGVPEDFWLPDISWGVLQNLVGLLAGYSTPPGVAPAPWHFAAAIGGLTLLLITAVGCSRYGRILLKSAAVGELSTSAVEDLPGWLRNGTLGVWLLGPVVLMACLSWLDIELFTVRNLIFIAPAFTLAAAELTQRVSQPSLRALVLALLIAVPAANLPGYFMSERKEQWRAAGGFVMKMWRDGDAVVVDAWFVRRLFEYYIGHTITPVDVFSDSLGDVERLWLVRSHSHDPSRNIQRAIVKNGLRQVMARRFPRIEVGLYSRTGSAGNLNKPQSTSIGIPGVEIVIRSKTEPPPTLSTP